MEKDAISDEQLLKKLISEGNTQLETELLFRELLQRCKNTIIGAIKSVVRKNNPADIDDLLQQVHLRICSEDYLALRSFNSEKGGSVKLYIFNVARNQVIDTIRVNKALIRPNVTNLLSEPDEENHSETRGSMLVSPELNPEEALIQKEQLNQINAVIDAEKDPQKRELDHKIIDACIEGYTRTEIANMEELGVTRTTVNNRFFRLKERVQVTLKSNNRKPKKNN
jgi:RNA polymerase sigma factor (sigma-70 family)